MSRGPKGRREIAPTVRSGIDGIHAGPPDLLAHFRYRNHDLTVVAIP